MLSRTKVGCNLFKNQTTDAMYCPGQTTDPVAKFFTCIKLLYTVFLAPMSHGHIFYLTWKG